MTDLLPAPPEGTAPTDGAAPHRLDPISDPELAAQALAADAVDVADDDAVSYREVTERQDLGLLPDWYMPGPGAGARRLDGWKRNLAWLLVGTFLAINAAGLCSTYGRIEGWGFGS